MNLFIVNNKYYQVTFLFEIYQQINKEQNMINFKPTYDSNEIREGLMSIKQSQMELLRQLKSENHILKKYTPENPIFEEGTEYNNKSQQKQQYSHHNIIGGSFEQLSQTKHNKPTNYLSSVSNTSYLSSKNTSRLKQQQDNNYYQKLTNMHGMQQNNTNNGVKSIYGGMDNVGFDDLMTEELHRMKKLYFMEKQKIKDMILHMEFAASLHNAVLKDVLQGVSLDNIKMRIRQEMESYQREFPEFKAFGLQQAFNIINLQSDIALPTLQPRTTPKRTQIFPPRYNNSNHFQQAQNEVLKQLNDLKCELRELSLQKQRKAQQVRLVRSQKQYSTEMLTRELQMKQSKINEMVGEMIRLREELVNLKDTNCKLQKQISQLQSNILRLKSQLQRNLNKIQTLQKKNSSSQIDKQHQYAKKVQILQGKIREMEKQDVERFKLIKSLEESVGQLQGVNSQMKGENQRLELELRLLKQQVENKNNSYTQLQKKFLQQHQAHQQQLHTLTTHNQHQQSSLKQHIHHLKLNLQQLLHLQQQYKQSQQHLSQLKQRKIQSIKLSKTVDHLWRIKQVQYDNVTQLLTQLNFIQPPQVNNYIRDNNMTKQHRRKRSSSSKSKQRQKQKQKQTNKKNNNNR